MERVIIKYFIYSQRADIFTDIGIFFCIIFLLYTPVVVFLYLIGFPEYIPISIKKYWWVISIVFLFLNIFFKIISKKYDKFIKENGKYIFEITNETQRKLALAEAYEANRYFLERIMQEMFLIGVLVGFLALGDFLPRMFE